MVSHVTAVLGVDRAGLLLQLELDELEPRGAGVLDPAGFAGVLPDEIAIIGSHAPVRVAGNGFRQHPTVDIDTQTRRGLRHFPSRLARLQDDAPRPQTSVVHDLRKAGDARSV